MVENYDFSGWATRANMRCSDGRIIAQNAFKDCDGARVPLVWNHRQDDPENVLGYAILEHRDEGVYTYGFFNESPKALDAKILVQHGDITQLSIFANHLTENGPYVLHGAIKEVSLVYAGANPGAFIDSVIAHNDDGSAVVDREQGIIFTGEDLVIAHADGDDAKSDPESSNQKKTPEEDASEEETVGDVYNTLTDKQKVVVVAMVEQAIRNYDKEHSSDDETKQKEETPVKKNVFNSESSEEQSILTHADGIEILKMAKSYGGGSLKAACEAYIAEHEDTLAHADLGFDNIGTLFPEYKNVTPGAPAMLTDDTGWVSKVLAKVHKSPISRIKTRQADVRAISSRANGYTKGQKKKLAGNLKLLSRTTDPKTITVRSNLDRDDTIDIEDFDVVQYLYNVDRMALNEKLAMAMLISDGLPEGDADKVDETKIRPIWTDDDLYTIHATVDLAAMRKSLQGSDTSKYFGDDYIYAEAIIQTLLKARVQYRGSGNADWFCPSTVLNSMLLARDRNGRRIFDSVNEVAAALNVREIIPCEEIEGRTRVAGEGASAKTKKLLGLFVNMNDYTLGCSKGGQITHMTDFDIDFNQLKSLLETRVSGALTRPYAAIAVEMDVEAASSEGEVA